MAASQSDPVTPEDLVKVAENLGYQECIPLASALGFDHLYINKLRSSPIADDTPNQILWKWQAAHSSDATRKTLCEALSQIGRRDLAEAISAQRTSEDTRDESRPQRQLSISSQKLAKSSKLCTDVAVKPGETPHDLEELASAVRLHHKTLQAKPFSWLKGVKAIDAGTFFLNIAMVEKTFADEMKRSLASSSANEIKRHEYLYAQKQTLLRLDRLFPKFRAEQTCKWGPMAKQSQSAEAVISPETLLQRPAVRSKSALLPSASDVPAVVLSEEEDSQCCVLQSAQRVCIFGAAGTGKTSCLMKAARMYADEQLWPGARAFLLWKLRDPKVQKAENLEQLLRQLKPGLAKDKCKAFADVLDACEGEEVILALDGIDELDTQKKDGFVWSLLDGSALSKACVLATSRPCSVAETYFDRYELNLELLGFTEEQVDLFIEQQFADKPELASDLHRVLVDNPTLASLMLIPLLAMMVCQVFHLTAENPPTTRTLLYSKLLALVVRRTVGIEEGRVPLPTDENRLALAISDVRKLTGTPKKLVSELAEVAFQAHEQGMAVFDDIFLMEQAKCSDEALQLGLLSCYSVEEEIDIVHQYSFQHLTVQEFLVAYRLVINITCEEDLDKKVDGLISSTHNHVVLQFFAGLLTERFRPYFFTLLDRWLHEAYDQLSDDRHSRLRVCLQCAKEACGGDVEDFPSTLELPKHVYLSHVTAADLTQLSLALEKSQHIEGLSLEFDLVVVKSENRKVSRVMTQTRRAMTRLMVAVNANKSLRTLRLNGPKYSLFEERGWRLLAQTLEKNSLVVLWVVDCELDNTTFHFLSNALKHNTQLKDLWLIGNSLDDVSVCGLADVLKDNKTLQALHLHGNSYGEESRERLLHQLKHIPDLTV